MVPSVHHLSVSLLHLWCLRARVLAVCSMCLLSGRYLFNTSHSHTDSELTTSFVSKKAWYLGKDVRDRPGLMRTLNDRTHCERNDNGTVSFIINADHLTSSIPAATVKKSTPLLLKIVYLKSYVNMGVVDVYVCNRYVATLDALWSDCRTFHYSMPQVVHLVVKDASYCFTGNNSGSNGSSGSSVSYGRISGDTVTPEVVKGSDTTRPSVDLVHRIQNCSVTAAAQLSSLQPRLAQMFKVTQIKLCHLL